jgi:hypothetical protein
LQAQFLASLHKLGLPVDLGPPPADPDKQEAPIMKELWRLAFEGVADKLENPSDQEERKSVNPQMMKEDTGEKKCGREQDGGNAQRVAETIYWMLMAGAVLRDPFLVGASAEHAE